jgi:hypothetical protein
VQVKKKTLKTELDAWKELSSFLIALHASHFQRNLGLNYNTAEHEMRMRPAK